MSSFPPETELSDAVIATVPALVIVSDGQGVVRRFNRAAERATGLPAAEVIGRPIWDALATPERAEQVKRMFLESTAETYPRQLETVSQDSDGVERHFSWTNAVVPDSSGGIGYVVATGIDVTERAAAERLATQQEARLDAFFNHAPAVLYWRDLDGVYVNVNDEFAAQVGKPREEVLGLTVYELFPEEVADSFMKTDREVIEARERLTTELKVPTPEGERIYRSVLFPLFDEADRPYGVAGISTDVTDLIRARDERELAQRETIARLARAVEYKDEDTGEHIERMSAYCELLARRLDFPAERCELIRLASPMHDAGKIAVPDEILLKPGRLTPEERKEMERHTEVGYDLLTGSSYELLDLAASIALTHHERFDGTGYPRGLRGWEIPVEGRLAAVADVFDALSSDRVYRPAMPIDECLEIMRAGRESHFDPEVLDVFLENLDTVLEIRTDSVRQERAAPVRTLAGTTSSTSQTEIQPPARTTRG